MGRLLAGMARRDPGAVREQLAAARHEIMAPVSAAAMESYARAYPHLVRLHMLQEVADAAALIQVVLQPIAATWPPYRAPCHTHPWRRMSARSSCVCSYQTSSSPCTAGGARCGGARAGAAAAVGPAARGHAGRAAGAGPHPVAAAPAGLVGRGDGGHRRGVAAAGEALPRCGCAGQIAVRWCSSTQLTPRMHSDNGVVRSISC